MTHLLSDWVVAIWNASWQGGRALMLAWLICRAFPRLSPRLQCWLWRLAYLKLLVALVWTTPFRLPLLPPAPALPALAALLETQDSPFPAERALPSSPSEAPYVPGTVILSALFCLWL